MDTQTQPKLDFEIGKAVRATDPVTSRMAAEQVAPRVAGDRLRALGIFYRLHPVAIDDFELSEFTRTKQTSIGKRRGELERMGYVEKAERRVSPSPLTNSVVQSYRLTEAGRKFYEANR